MDENDPAGNQQDEKECCWKEKFWCFTQKTKEEVVNENEKQVELLERSICPNIPECGNTTYDLYWFESFKKISIENKAKEFIGGAGGKDEQCSYWVKPPK